MRQVGEENVHNSRVKNLRNAAEILIQNGGVTRDNVGWCAPREVYWTRDFRGEDF